MFGDFIRRLTAPDPAPLPETDARLALGALLVRLARSDGDYAVSEREKISKVLARRYGLSDPEPLLRDCEELEAQAPDTVRFTRAIKDAVAYDERTSVMKAMWEVVLADGARGAEEDSIMRMVAPLLGVTDQDSNIARREVEQGK
ncbi:tellurite resistance TerB family protein [Yoonia sp. 208BN28-4]|uniref:tellurite resistance TerB family protein n=1 Tax=Yoonia sp. 208BN28-4 TaxID=3126505 RepID=UPI0030ABD7F9